MESLLDVVLANTREEQVPFVWLDVSWCPVCDDHAVHLFN